MDLCRVRAFCRCLIGQDMSDRTRFGSRAHSSSKRAEIVRCSETERKEEGKERKKKKRRYVRIYGRACLRGYRVAIIDGKDFACTSERPREATWRSERASGLESNDHAARTRTRSSPAIPTCCYRHPSDRQCQVAAVGTGESILDRVQVVRFSVIASFASR